MSLTYLALGDSYTIGEQVPLADNFPYQAVQMLRSQGLDICAPEIVAKTGWTTDELLNAINNTQFLPGYDMVSLLIGVNNQYRGRSVENFKPEFELLLQRAIQFAGRKPVHVIVISIPDWSLTPFAKGKDFIKIGSEIDAYNYACRNLSKQYHCNYIDITTSQRQDAADLSFVAGDGLHPSGQEYKKWAQQLAEVVGGF